MKEEVHPGVVALIIVVVVVIVGFIGFRSLSKGSVGGGPKPAGMGAGGSGGAPPAARPGG